MEAQSIVETLAAVIQRPITLEDLSGYLIAYSVHNAPVDAVRLETLLRKGASLSTRQILQDKGIYKLIDDTNGIASVPDIPEIGLEPRIAAAVRRGGKVLGYLWVACDSATVTPETERLILEAARLLGKELLGGFSREAQERQVQERPTLIKELIGGAFKDESEIHIRAHKAGWPANPLFGVLVLAISSGSNVQISWYLKELAGAIKEEFPYVLTGIVDGYGILIVSGLDADGFSEVLEKVVSGFHKRAESSVAVGIGNPYESPKDIPKSYTQALKAIRLGTTLSPDENFYDYTSFASYDLLSCLAQCPTCGLYGREQVETVRVYDSMHGQNLLKTLEAYLDWYGSRKKAASVLKIHPNTLDYRVKKISELIKMDLNDPSARLSLHVWVKALAAPKKWSEIASTRSQ